MLIIHTQSWYQAFFLLLKNGGKMPGQAKLKQANEIISDQAAQHVSWIKPESMEKQEKL